MREASHSWSEQEFKSQYVRYYRALVVYVLKAIADENAAQDIVQEVFLNILRLKRTFRDELQLRSYLYASARNKALDYLKHLNVEQTFISKVKDGTSCYAITASGEEEFFTEEVYRRLFELVDALPPRQRDVFVKLMEGKKLHEIAEEMNVSFETVRTQKARGLSVLRKHMNPEMAVVLISLIG